jgi:hypothetical protein
MRYWSVCEVLFAVHFARILTTKSLPTTMDAKNTKKCLASWFHKD